MESSDVVSMFPTLAWKIQLSEERMRSLNASILTVLREMRRDVPALAAGQAWQSAHSLHELAAFGGLVECAQRAVRSVLEFLKIGYDEFSITGCWANVSGPGAAHGMHSHPNNFLSGIYYVQAQPGADTVNFHDPRIQAGIIRPPVTELTAANTDQVVVRVKDGTLLLFPSYLQHSVSPNESDAERISVSFNVMFSAFAETMSKPLW